MQLGKRTILIIYLLLKVALPAQVNMFYVLLCKCDSIMLIIFIRNWLCVKKFKSYERLALVYTI